MLQEPSSAPTNLDMEIIEDREHRSEIMVFAGCDVLLPVLAPVLVLGLMCVVILREHGSVGQGVSLMPDVECINTLGNCKLWLLKKVLDLVKAPNRNHS